MGAVNAMGTGMNIELIPGATKRLLMTLVSGSPPYTLASPKINLTGCTVTAEGGCGGPAKPVVSIVDALLGKISILWTAASTAGYNTPGAHDFSIWVDYPSGDRQRWLLTVTIAR